MTKPMDNFLVKVQSYGDDHLEAAISICMDERDGTVAWSINPNDPSVLWLFQWVLDGDKAKVNMLPCEMDRRATIEFVKGWLRGLRKAAGSRWQQSGFIVTNGSDGGWTSNRGIILTVGLAWAMHGK